VIHALFIEGYFEIIASHILIAFLKRKEKSGNSNQKKKKTAQISKKTIFKILLWLWLFIRRRGLQKILNRTQEVLLDLRSSSGKKICPAFPSFAYLISRVKSFLHIGFVTKTKGARRCLSFVLIGVSGGSDWFRSSYSNLNKTKCKFYK
jgi:hypothetical protein